MKVKSKLLMSFGVLMFVIILLMMAGFYYISQSELAGESALFMFRVAIVVGIVMLALVAVISLRLGLGIEMHFSQMEEEIFSLTETCRKLQLQTTGLAESLIKGEAEKPLDTEKLQAYREISININQLLSQAHKNRLELYAARDNLARLISDIASLSGRVSDGDLTKAIDYNNYDANWKAVITSVNSLLESTKAPVTEAVSVLEAAEGGNFQRRAQGGYKGTFASLTQLINVGLDKLKHQEEELGTLQELNRAMHNINAMGSQADDRLSDLIYSMESLKAISANVSKILQSVDPSVLKGAQAKTRLLPPRRSQPMSSFGRSSMSPHEAEGYLQSALRKIAEHGNLADQVLADMQLAMQRLDPGAAVKPAPPTRALALKNNTNAVGSAVGSPSPSVTRHVPLVPARTSTAPNDPPSGSSVYDRKDFGKY